MRCTLLSLCLLAALSSTACKAPTLAASASPEATQAPLLPADHDGVLSAEEADRILKGSSPQQLRLLSAGAEPRSTLRYAFKQGATERLELVIDMRRRMSKMGQPIPQLTFPPVTALLELEPTEQSAAGEWKIHAKLTQLSAQTQGDAEQQRIAEEVNPGLKQVQGYGLSFWMSPTGEVRRAQSAQEDMAPEQLETLLDITESIEAEITTPLPAEPVGVGARWHVLTRTPGSGMDLIQSATYTLKERTGNRVVVDMLLDELTASQRIYTPDMPEGYSVLVKSFDSTETGTWELDLTSITPDAGSSSRETKVTLGEQGEGADPADELRVESETRLRLSRPAAR